DRISEANREQQPPRGVRKNQEPADEISDMGKRTGHGDRVGGFVRKDFHGGRDNRTTAAFVEIKKLKGKPMEKYGADQFCGKEMTTVVRALTLRRSCFL